MADPSDQWELEPIKVQDLDPTFKRACGNKITADRRFYRYKGKKGNESEKAGKKVDRYIYCPAIRLDWSVSGYWGAGAFVNSKEFDEISQALPTVIFNPVTGQKTNFGQNSPKINENELRIGDNAELQDNLKKYYKKEDGERGQYHGSPNLDLWKPIDASGSRSEFTLKTEGDVLDPDDNLFVTLDTTSTSAFGFSAGDVYIQSSTMKALIEDSDAFFSKKDNIAARNNAGDPISLDVANIANAHSVMSNKKKWAEVFRSSTGTGSYVPPRALNPQIDIWLEWTNTHLKYDEFITLVGDVVKKAESNKSEIKTLVKFFKQEKDLEKKYFKIGECPLGGYNTWVSHDTFNEFREQRSERAIPDKSAVKRAQNNIPATVEKQGSTKDTVANDLRKKVYGDKYQGHLKTGDYVVLQSKVSARSMASTEASPRSAFPDQGVVWGGHSASQVAADLEWTANPTATTWAKGGLGEPEWLHRAAYSWGGIVYKEPGTSQIPENLVFGTYETNSIMTRYESVWQELLRILDAVDNKAFAFLRSTNPMEGQVPCLKEDANEWRYEDFEKDASQWQPWLCYKLDYKLELQNCRNKYDWAKYLNGCFFPFQRLFFTSVEAKIDKAILKALLKKTW